MRTKIILFLACMAGLFGTTQLLSAGSFEEGGSSLQVQSQPTAADQTIRLPRVIYVQDFALEAHAVKADEGLRDRHLLQRLPSVRPHASPEQHARQLVTLMAESLVEELTALGFFARRLPPESGVPLDGWFVSGVFTEVDEGKRLRRATIGFGSGSSEMEVQVMVSDQARNPSEPFLVIGTIKDPKKMPGAIITKNPYVAAAKFVVDKNPSDKDVKKAARAIAAEIRRFSDSAVSTKH